MAIERVLTMPLETIEGELAGAIQVGTDIGDVILPAAEPAAFPHPGRQHSPGRLPPWAAGSAPAACWSRFLKSRAPPQRSPALMTSPGASLKAAPRMRSVN